MESATCLSSCSVVLRYLVSSAGAIHGEFPLRHKYNVPAPKGVVKINDEELQRYAQKDNSYILECQGHHKICVNKSEDCFYIFWTPRNGKATGPGNCVIEKVDLYEVIE